MKGFRREADGSVIALIDPTEVAVINDLAEQLRILLTSDPDTDPALLRLLPDAYPEDPDASAEFRRYTHDSLVGRKLAGATTVIETLNAAVESSADDTDHLTLTLTHDQTVAWLTTLTDIRLTLAIRMGIVEDDQRSDDVILQDLYDWLGFVQNALVETLGS